jgi:hypothetical protein
MHRTILSTLLATTALAAAAPAWAQGQPADEPTALDEIIVSARRERESLQDVPVSVQAVTGAQIQDLAITQATEISKVAPGININGPTGNGVDFELVLRGVRWTAASGTPAIAAYLNDAPFLPTSVLSSLYDVGQIEILRGPQGTTRGAPSISGAVTVTTRRPNLAEYGGDPRGRLLRAHPRQPGPKPVQRGGPQHAHLERAGLVALPADGQFHARCDVPAVAAERALLHAGRRPRQPGLRRARHSPELQQSGDFGRRLSVGAGPSEHYRLQP